MALTFDPFREMDRLTAQLLSNSRDQARASRWMPMDLYRAGDHYVVTADLPGIDPGTIDLDVDGTTLTIQAERTVGSPEGASWIAQERPAGRFVRQLSLGDGLDVEKIHAAYENGVLSLTIPVAEKARPRKITVEHSGGQRQVGSTSNEQVQGEVTAGA